MLPPTATPESLVEKWKNTQNERKWQLQTLAADTGRNHSKPASRPALQYAATGKRAGKRHSSIVACNCSRQWREIGLVFPGLSQRFGLRAEG